MATAVRITVSIPSDLDASMREHGLSPSALLADAIRERVGINGARSTAERLTDLDKTVRQLARRIGKLERAQTVR